MKQTFNKIKKVAYLEDTNCCTVIASAIAFNKPFDEVQKYFFSIGRKRNQGFHFFRNLDKICKKYNYEYKTIANNRWEVKDMFKTGLTANNCNRYLDLETYFLETRGHVFTLKNGTVEDWTKGRKHLVKQIVKVKPIKKVKDLNFKKIKYDFSEF